MDVGVLFETSLTISYLTRNIVFKMKEYKIGVVISPPFVTKCGLEWTISNSQKCADPGFSVEILLIILKILNLKGSFLQENGGFGRKNGSTWNGLVGGLVSEEYDFVVPVLGLTADRSEVVRYSETAVHLYRYFMLANPKVKILFTNLRQPFREDIWILGILAFGVVCALLFALLRDKDGNATSEFFNFLYLVPFHKRNEIFRRTTNSRFLLTLWSLATKFLTINYCIIFVRSGP